MAAYILLSVSNVILTFLPLSFCWYSLRGGIFSILYCAIMAFKGRASGKAIKSNAVRTNRKKSLACQAIKIRGVFGI